MACHLTATSYHWNQSSRIIRCVLWDSPGSNITRNVFRNLILIILMCVAHLSTISLPGNHKQPQVINTKQWYNYCLMYPPHSEMYINILSRYGTWIINNWILFMEVWVIRIIRTWIMIIIYVAIMSWVWLINFQFHDDNSVLPSEWICAMNLSSN